MEKPQAPDPQHVQRNQQEYGLRYAALRFPSPGAAAAATSRREDLLQSLAGRAALGCRGTKLDCAGLSPGCRLCVEGAWSCLFVNGRCNGRCFYCPAPQDEEGVPTTNTLSFPEPQAYVEYVERLGFRGVSLSGGEPLVTLETTVAYAAAVKRRFGAQVHLWVYTNGLLATPQVLARLRDAGVDEIRFDIGATSYDLDRARRAVGVIPTVTVEIPAVPEELERMRGKLAEIHDSGIAHLNLHQLRLTPHNFEHLASRGYTFLHGERVTVLESELTALELLCHALDQHLDLPVNYCSFVYKSRFQRAAARQRAALLVCAPHEAVTTAGYLRSAWLHGTAQQRSTQIRALEARGVAPAGWALAPDGERLHVAAGAWHALDVLGPPLQLQYWEVRVRPGPSPRHPCTELRCGSATLYVERVAQGEPVWVRPDTAGALAQVLLHPGASPGPQAADCWPQLEPLEWVEAGLQEYG